MAEESRFPFERHAQTAIQLVLVALLVWAGDSLNTLQQTAARQEERLISMTTMMETQASTINSLENGQIDLRIRVDRLEQRKRE